MLLAKDFVVRKNFPYSGKSTVAEEPKKPQSVQIQPAAYDGLVKLQALMAGASLGAVNSRMINWFMTLEKKFQAAVLTDDAETRREFALLALREMAGVDSVAVDTKGMPATHEECERIIRAMLDRMAQISLTDRVNLEAQIKRNKKK